MPNLATPLLATLGEYLLLKRVCEWLGNLIAPQKRLHFSAADVLHSCHTCFANENEKLKGAIATIASLRAGLGAQSRRFLRLSLPYRDDRKPRYRQSSSYSTQIASE